MTILRLSTDLLNQFLGTSQLSYKVFENFKCYLIPSEAKS